MRAWPLRGWATRTLVLTVVVLVAGALVTVGNAWADQGHRRGHNASKSANHGSTHRVVADHGRHDVRVRNHIRGNDKQAMNRKGSTQVDPRSAAKDSKASAAASTSRSGTTATTSRQAWRSTPSPAAASVGPAPASAAPTAGRAGVDATVSAVAGSAVADSALRKAAAVSSPAVAFASVCEPGGRRVTATITNSTDEAVTATITTASHQSTKEVAASGRASVVLHLASGKAVVIAIGADHVSFLAPECAEPAQGPDAGGSATAAPPSATGLALSLERACETAGEPVAVRVANSAAIADEVVVAGVSKPVPAKADVALSVPGAGTGDVVTVTAGPTRYELTVPPCTQVAPLASGDARVLSAGLGGGAGGGLNSDVALIVAGLAAVALSVGVLVLAAARRLWWGRLR